MAPPEHGLLPALFLSLLLHIALLLLLRNSQVACGAGLWWPLGSTTGRNTVGFAGIWLLSAVLGFAYSFVFEGPGP